MKLISLWEPWATLMSLGVKRIETRSWSTDYRGWLAIQASKGGLSNSELEDYCTKQIFHDALCAYPAFNAWAKCATDGRGKRPSMKRWNVFPFGCIVALVKLDNCWPTDKVFSVAPDLDTDQERAFGNYDKGRWAWVTSDLFTLPKPIQFTAKQGLMDVPHETVIELRAQWKSRKTYA